MKLLKLSTIMVVAALLLAATTGPTMGAVNDPLDSSDFAVQFNFDVDGEMPAGFPLYKTVLPTIADGTMLYETAADQNDYAYFMSSAGQIWDTSGVTWGTGYTVETRIRVDAIAPDVTMATIVYTVPVGGSGPAGWLNINPGELTWGYPAQEDYSWDVDNSDDFHVFRFAQEPGLDSFSIWRDEVLLASEIGKGWNYPGLVRMLFGDAGGSGGGDYEMDYMRFTPGAYAPPPPPMYLPGDANLDDVVDDVDAAFLTANWLTQGGATWAMGDFNGDGNVDDADATLLAANWQTTAGAASVPEPGMLTLLALGLLSLLALRRKSA